MAIFTNYIGHRSYMVLGQIIQIYFSSILLTIFYKKNNHQKGWQIPRTNRHCLIWLISRSCVCGIVKILWQRNNNGTLRNNEMGTFCWKKPIFTMLWGITPPRPSRSAHHHSRYVPHMHLPCNLYEWKWYGRYLKKSKKQELTAAHLFNLINIPTKFYQNISKHMGGISCTISISKNKAKKKKEFI